MINISKIPTPCYVCDEALLQKNLDILDYVQRESGAKILLALVSIAVYGSAILLRRVLSIRGKRSAIVSIGGFAIILFSLLIVDQFLPSFHQY